MKWFHPRAAAALGALMLFAATTGAADKADALIFGGDGPLSRNLQKSLAAHRISSRIGGDRLDGVRLLVVPPEVRLSEELRRQLPEFFKAGGALLTMGPENFGVPAPQPGKLKLLPELDPASGLWECRGSKILRSGVYAGPNARRFLEIVSPEMRDGSIFFKYKKLDGLIGRDDRLLVFRACGDYESNLVSVSVTDRDGNQFVSYADLDREWRDYVLRFADFVPLGKPRGGDFEFGGKLDGEPAAPPAIALDPANISSIAIGLSNRHLWWDKPGRIQLADIAVAPDLAASAGRSGYAMRYAVPYGKNNILLGDDGVDLFDGGEAIAGAVLQPSAWATEVLAVPAGKIQAARAFAVPPRPFIRGREEDDKAFTDAIRRRADRRITVLASADGRPAAQLILPADELNTYGAAGVIGLPAAAYAADGAGLPIFGAMANYLLNRPQIAGVFIDLSGTPERTGLVARVRLRNPAPRPADVALTLNAGPLPAVAAPATVPAGQALDLEIPLPEVPEAFPFTGFDWSMTLGSTVGNDRIGSAISAAKTLEYLTDRMLFLQSTHRDGRISHHYFSDIYGVRAMVALGTNTGRPELVRAGERLLEGLTSRQFAEGALPMGYGEAKRIGWVADNGTAVLALVQLASWLPERREHYLDVTRRYYDWRETFYISPERAKELAARFGPSEETMIAGTYGIGYNDGPFFEREKLKETIRIERGYPWVLGISMVSLPGYYQLTGDAKVLATAERNLRDYLPLVPSPNYFGAEALYWMYRYLPDRALAKQAAARIADGFVPAVLADRGFIAFERGGRKTLDLLSLIYYWREFENSPRIRAALLKHIWNHADPDSPFSVYRVGAQVRHSSHGFSIAAARYAGTVSSVWFAELLYPESTLLKPSELRFPPKLK